MNVEAHGYFFCGSGKLFVGESVCRVLFEGYELGVFCKGFDVECSGSPYDYGDYFDVRF